VARDHRIIAAASGRKKQTLPAPVGVMRAAASLLDRFEWFPVTREQLQMLLEGNACDGSEAWRLFGIEPKRFSVENLGYLRRSPVTQARNLTLVFGASGYVGGHLVPRLLAAGRPVRAVRGMPRRWTVPAGRASSGSRPTPCDRRRSTRRWRRGHGVLPRALDARGQGLRPARPGVRGEFRRRGARAGVRGSSTSGADAGGHAVAAPRLAQGDRRPAAGRAGARGRDPGGHHRRPGLGRVRGHRDLVNTLPGWSRRAGCGPARRRSRWTTCSSTSSRCRQRHAAGGIYDAAGPEVLSYEELMRGFGELVGRKPRILPVPVLSPMLSSYWLGLVTTVPTPVARALIGGLAHDSLRTRRRCGAGAAAAARLPGGGRGGARGRAPERGGGALDRGRADVPQLPAGLRLLRQAASGSAVSSASPEEVWRVVSAIGGATAITRWTSCGPLRELGDWFVGGPGLNRGRRDPAQLRVGDTVDSWQVIGLEPGQAA
jgi:hypothetical protein